MRIKTILFLSLLSCTSLNPASFSLEPGAYRYLLDSGVGVYTCTLDLMSSGAYFDTWVGSDTVSRERGRWRQDGSTLVLYDREVVSFGVWTRAVFDFTFELKDIEQGSFTAREKDGPWILYSKR